MNKPPPSPNKPLPLPSDRTRKGPITMTNRQDRRTVVNAIKLLSPAAWAVCLIVLVVLATKSCVSDEPHPQPGVSAIVYSQWASTLTNHKSRFAN